MQSHFSAQSESDLFSLLSKGELSSTVGSRVITQLVSGNLSSAQARATLVLLAARGETTHELLAAWKAIRKAEYKTIFTEKGALDTCGTGGDGSHSINLSTLSSFVMAAAGVKVIKHGNRAITSRCGSSDLLSSFGFNLNQDAKRTIQSANKIGMGYFHAPHVHPVYSHFQNLRKGIRVRTLFNLLGPVLNPVAVDYQILGIASEPLLPIYAKLLPQMNRKSALIVLGANGLDEITTLGISKGLKLSGKSTSPWSLNPLDYGFKKGRASDLKIKSIAHAKKITVGLLKNKKEGTALDSVILSAACGIWISHQAKTLGEAIQKAKQAVKNGSAWTVLNHLIQFSNL